MSESVSASGTAGPSVPLTPPTATPPPSEGNVGGSVRISEPRNDSWGWRWIAFPLVSIGGAGLSYVFDRFGYSSLTRIPGFDGDSLKNIALFGRTAADFARSWTFTTYVSDPDLPEWAVRIAEGAYVTAGAFALAEALGKESGGDPELYVAINAAADVFSTEMRRLAGPLWGSVIQGVAGAGAMVVGLSLRPCGRADVAERDIYVSGDSSSGHFDLPGNPYEQRRFPNFCTNMTVAGGLHLSLGAVSAIYYGVHGEEEGGSASPGEPSVSFQPLPGGGIAFVSGEF